MNRLYIVDSTKPITEHVINTMSCIEGVPQYVDFVAGNVSLEDYKIVLGNPNLIAITWEEFGPRLLEYKDSLCWNWEAISEEAYYNLLECVPPKRWRNIPTVDSKLINVFAVGECYTLDLHTHCVLFEGRHFKALAPIGVDDITLANKFIHFINKQS